MNCTRERSRESSFSKTETNPLVSNLTARNQTLQSLHHKLLPLPYLPSPTNPQTNQPTLHHLRRIALTPPHHPLHTPDHPPELVRRKVFREMLHHLLMLPMAVTMFLPSSRIQKQLRKVLRQHGQLHQRVSNTPHSLIKTMKCLNHL